MGSFDGAVQMKSKARVLYDREYYNIGPDRVETWLTKEEATGFLLGWEGCMAEDSISFKSAFSATKIDTDVRGDKTYHIFKNDQPTVPSKIMAGKIGDVSIRFGRFKFIRFNPPKDVRAGLSRQHIASHYGKEWTPETGCHYSESGELLTPGCTVEPLCRNSTSFGTQYCMRDHYYQLWDLETNFGEKMLCDEKQNRKIFSGVTPAKHLHDSLGLSARGMTKGGEKGTGFNGYSVGQETSPLPLYTNDCCVLSHYEPEEPKLTRSGSPRSGVDPCSQMQINVNGKLKTGGVCKYREQLERKYGKIRHNSFAQIDAIFRLSELLYMISARR